MSEIHRLLDELTRLHSGDDNKRRLSLWAGAQCGTRGDVQWHGIPAYGRDSGRPMPVTVECLEKVWTESLGLDLARYYTEPEYYLEYCLRIKLKKFKEFRDDTPLTLDIPVAFGVTHEAGMLGQKVFLDHGEEPSFAPDAIVDENSELPSAGGLAGAFSVRTNPYLAMAVPFFEKVRSLAGRGFNVIFPQWFRGPQGVAVYIRGFENFSLDMYLNPQLAHRIMRYVTDAAMAFNRWRSEYLGEPIARGDLFNDDVPLMSADSYREFFLPYEQELADFYGGVHYWHSCGDITRHVSEVHKLRDAALIDFGVTMEDKAEGVAGLSRPQDLELRVKAQTHVQACSEEQSREYVRGILRACESPNVGRYVIRSSGMSILLGAAEDIRKLGRWVELVREVQAELSPAPVER